MRKAVNLLLPFFLLIVFCMPAGTQPARQQQRDARCREAALRYIHPSPDKKHLTVEQEDDYEYRQKKKYLAVCGDSDDDFTRRIRQEVAGHEAAGRPSPGPCDEATRARLYQRFRENYNGDAVRQEAAYDAAAEYVCRCAEYDQITLYVSTWIHKYASIDPAYPNPEAAAEAVAREDAKRPRCRCDEMREKLVNSLREQYGHEHSQQNHETVKKFLDICGDTRRPIDRFLGEWLTKYDKSVREFEEQKRQSSEAPAKGPAKEQ